MHNLNFKIITIGPEIVDWIIRCIIMKRMEKETSEIFIIIKFERERYVKIKNITNVNVHTTFSLLLLLGGVNKTFVNFTLAT